MAKKEENIGKENTERRANKSAPKAGEAAKKSKKSPPKSGKVKGPKGTGGQEKPKSRGSNRKAAPVPPAATTGFHEQESIKKLPAEKIEKLPEPPQALPEKTTNTEEHLVVVNSENKPTEVKQTGKTQKTTNPKRAKSETISDRNKTASEKVEKKKSQAKDDVEEQESSKKPPKKMARRKPVKGISAEEKSKLSNSSFSEDLKDKAKETARELSDKFHLDEEMQREIGELAKKILPDEEKIKENIEKLAKTIMPDPETVDKVKNMVTTEETSAKKGKNEKNSPAKTSGEPTLLSEFDIHLFREGKHFHLYKKLGSHLMNHRGTDGVYFAVWAPNAKSVSVIGDFNHWNRENHPMKGREDHSGIWEIFIPEARIGSIYKYFIRSNNGYEAEKGDPYAFMWETPPNTASIVWDLKPDWNDSAWLEKRKKEAGNPKPMSVYELHVGSWRRVPEDGNRSLSYREMAEQLPKYIQEMGFTHVEFMPVMEHPFFGSWGYQVTGYFAPSSRFGNPQDFMFLIDSLHQAGIGVILDWVPSHFPSDLHGLHYFDGTFLYEHADPQKGFHPDWQSYIFNYGRNEVRSFLISNAVFWLDKFHADGLRVDAVASMLYLDYSRKEGEWQPNEHGGRENLEALSFLKEFNEVVYGEFPDAVTIAEESTAWPMVSKPTYMGGLGFGMKWMMGWMHDTLEYFQKDAIHRKHHQNMITFSLNYAFSENFMLPLSHDEVVYGKQALLNKMPGDEWNKFANLRSLYSYMYAHPGTKLLFMGAEFGQTSEWNHDSSLDWHVTHESLHQKVQESLKALNYLYKTEPALYEISFEREGFEWLDINDADNSVISFLRKGKNEKDNIMVICNFTPVVRENYRIGVPKMANWEEIFNSDDERFGGSNLKNQNTIEATSLQTHNKDFSIALTLPPMAVLYLKQKQ